ncbi:MAG: hypothetical protein D6681_11945 [Calditrichaeota bacterium]|nr:MAG: hypothetical protein D6681_11945 [Calditrichota bacterium]
MPRHTAWILVFPLLISPLYSGAPVDTTCFRSGIAVSQTDTLIGSVALFDQTLARLEYTSRILAEKTFSNIHLQQDTAIGGYVGRLGITGEFRVLEHRIGEDSGEFVLYGSGKIKFFSARILVRFAYTQVAADRVLSQVTIAVDRRFPLLSGIIRGEAEKTLRFMQVLGKNLWEDQKLQRQLKAIAPDRVGITPVQSIEFGALNPPVRKPAHPSGLSEEEE